MITVPNLEIFVANIKSAIKRARQSESNRKHNVTIRSRVRTFLKKADAAISSGDKEAAQVAFKHAQSEMAKACSKGVFAKNKGARDISRLNTRLKALA